MALSDLQKGKVILFNDDLYVITDYSHSKRGRGGAVAQVKMKNIKSSKTTSKSFTESDKFEIAFLEERRMQFLYKEGENWVFMDNESFEQMTLPEEMLGDAAQYLKENIEVAGNFYQGNLLTVEPPNFVELEVTFTEPGVRGDTVSNTLKAATVETGAEIQVPLFIEKGDVLKVDTRDGRYVERV